MARLIRALSMGAPAFWKSTGTDTLVVRERDGVLVKGRHDGAPVVRNLYQVRHGALRVVPAEWRGLTDAAS